MKQPQTLFGKRLRDLRKKRSFSQKQLGIEIGLDEGVASARMNQYEVGSHSPKYSTALKIATALNVSAAYFYADEEDLAAFIVDLSTLNKTQRRKALKLEAESGSG